MRLPGFSARIAVLLALVFGYVPSWVFDLLIGPVTSLLPGSAGPAAHDRVSWAGVEAPTWIGLPSGVLSDGGGGATALSSLFGDSPTTTYAENLGVMSSTKVYSTAAYYVAALVAILLGLCPKFGAIVNATPGGVLGGVTVVLYGMIGLVGAKVWVDSRVDFGSSVNLVGLAPGIIAGIGGVSLKLTDHFELGGIALGSILVIVGYHLVDTGRSRSHSGHGSADTAPAR